MTNESRRAFERHYEGDYEGNLQRYGNHDHDDYVDDDLDNKWRGWQAALATRPDVNQELVEALDELVGLKRYKEVNGKNEYYTKYQPLTWEKAQQALAKHKNKNLTIKDLAGHKFDTSEYIILSDGIRRVYDSPAKHKAGESYVPNDETIAAMEDARAGRLITVGSTDNLIKELNNESAVFTEKDLVNTISMAIKESSINEDYKNPNWLEIRSKAIITALSQCGALNIKKGN